MRKVIEVLESSNWETRNHKMVVTISNTLDSCMREYLSSTEKLRQKVISGHYEKNPFYSRLLDGANKYNSFTLHQLGAVGVVPKKGAKIIMEETGNAVVFGYSSKDMMIDYIFADILDKFTQDFMNGKFSVDEYLKSNYITIRTVINSKEMLTEKEYKKAYKSDPKKFVRDTFPDLIKYYSQSRELLNAAAVPTLTTGVYCEGIPSVTYEIYPIKYFSKDLKEYGIFSSSGKDNNKRYSSEETSWGLSEYISSKSKMALNIQDITDTADNEYIKNLISSFNKNFKIK